VWRSWYREALLWDLAGSAGGPLGCPVPRCGGASRWTLESARQTARWRSPKPSTRGRGSCRQMDESPGHRG
jgi:hypothetical protein